MIRKILISTLAACVASLVTAMFAALLPSNTNAEPGVVGLVTGIIVFILSVFILSMNEVKKSGIDIVSGVFNSVNSIQNNIDLKSANFYAVAEEEYDGGMIDKGLWSQALVKAKGDESLRKVEYMKLRVMQLKQKS